MKKTVVLCAVLFAAVAVNAQVSFGVKAGVGINQEKFSLSKASPFLMPGVKVGFYAGPTLTFGQGVVSLHTELTYNLDGLRAGVSDLPVDIGGIAGMLPPETWEGSGVDPGEMGEITVDGALAVHYHTLRLPVMLKVKPAGGLSVLAGPYFSYRVAVGVAATDDIKTLIEASGNYSETMDNVRLEVKEAILPFDVGLALGVQYETEMGVFFEARYNLGLLNRFNLDYLDIDDDESIKPRNHHSSIQIGMGIKF